MKIVPNVKTIPIENLVLPVNVKQDSMTISVSIEFVKNVPIIALNGIKYLFFFNSIIKNNNNYYIFFILYLV